MQHILTLGQTEYSHNWTCSCGAHDTGFENKRDARTYGNLHVVSAERDQLRDTLLTIIASANQTISQVYDGNWRE